MKTLKLAAAAVAALTLVGCATIAGNNTRQIKVSSYPAGASVYVDNQQVGVTPALVTLPSNIYGGKSVLLRKKGYQEHAMMVNTKFQPVAILDIFLWPTFIVDAITGDLVKIDPANLELNATLERA